MFDLKSMASLHASSLFFKQDNTVLSQKHLPKYKNNARKYAVENLDWEKNAELLKKVFENIELVKPSTDLIYNVKKFEFGKYPYSDKFPFVYVLYSKIRKIGKFVFNKTKKL